MMFRDRSDAGKQLAECVTHLRADDVVVVGLPRGGVPVAEHVARVLGAPLDVILVRKLGVPLQPELGMGAIGEDGVRILNDEIVRMAGVSRDEMADVERRERTELERRARRYRADRERVTLAGKDVVIVDDGIATGSTAKAACEVARAAGAVRVVLAVPVAPLDWTDRMAGVADELISVNTPARFSAIGQFYGNFVQTTDDEVIACLDRARRAASPATPTIHSVVEAAESDVHQLVAVLGIGVVDDPDRPVLCADDLGLTRGDGCFDATRVVTDRDGTSRIDHLETHLDRFARSAAGLDIPFDGEAWRSLVTDALAAWTRPGEAVLRVMLTRGREQAPADPVTGLLTIAPIHESALAGRAGISVTTLDRGHAADMFTEVSWLLGGIKTLSYAINVAALREARRRGADDALFVSSDGFALEGPRAALLWRTGDRLATTPIDGTGILASITQAVVFERAAAEGVAVSYELVTVDDLVRADGAWLLSSGRLVAPIVQLDDMQLAGDPAWTERVWGWATGQGEDGEASRS